MDNELLGKLVAFRMVLADLVAREGGTQLLVESIRDARLRKAELLEVGPNQNRMVVIAAAQKELEEIYRTALEAMDRSSPRSVGDR